MDLRDIGWGGMCWIDLTKNREHRRAIVYRVINFKVIWKFSRTFATDGFSRKAGSSPWS
jgi:hypothetical protein